LATSPRVDIRQFCRLLKHTESPFTGQPFVPEEWQDSYFSRLFNTLKADGRRQYRKSFLFLPRKQGKTAMVAVIALYEGFFGQHGGQIIIAAGDREQARKLFDACKNFLDSCPGLAKRCRVYKNSIFFPHTKTTMQVISREAKTKHGFNPSLVIVDELHVQPNRDLIDVLTSGMGARGEPLVIYISTAGMDRIGPCYEEFQRAVKVRDGLIDDPTYLPCLYYAEDDDDPFSEETWRKAQPNYGVSVTKEFMEAEARLARETVADEVKFRTLYLNQWVSNGANRFFRMGQWDACNEPLRDTSSLPCYCGLDLSSTQDTTAFVAVWPGIDEDGNHDGTFDAFAHLFLPESNADKDEAPYRQWARGGFVTLTEGDIVDYDVVRNYVLSFCEKNVVRGVAIDRWNATHITTQLTAEGVVVKPYGQGYASMSAPMKLLSTLVLGKKIRHGGNPALAYQMSNLQIRTDDAGNIKPTKANSHSTARIDAPVACVMALGLASGEAIMPDDDPQLVVF
jgi:phage terminase large subunit-like protein